MAQTISLSVLVLALMLNNKIINFERERIEAWLELWVRVSVVLTVFFGSLYVGPLYVLGDQVHYRRIYSGLAELTLFQGYTFYTTSIDSLEFVHFFLSWIASRILDKDVFVALANAFLAWVAFGVFVKWKASIYIAALLVITNYYLVAMYFSAERLKFGFIFMGLSFLYLGRVGFFYSFSFLALISHAQTIIVYFALFFRLLCEQFLRFSLTGRVSKYLFIVVVLLLLPTALIMGQLLSKFNSYYEGIRGANELMRVLIFFFLTLYYAKKKPEVICIFVSLIATVMLVGGERVNLLAYFAFLYYALPVNKGINFGVLFTGVYFAFGSFEYVLNIFEYGNNKPPEF